MNSRDTPLKLLLAIVPAICFSLNTAAYAETAGSKHPVDKGVRVRTGSIDPDHVGSMARALSGLRETARSPDSSGPGDPALKKLLTHRQQHPPYLGAAKSATGNAGAVGIHALNIHWNQKNATPAFIEIPATASAKVGVGSTSASADLDLAYDFIETHRDLFRLHSPRTELVPTLTAFDPDGRRHIQLQQTHRGVPLWGHDLVVHLASDGSPYALNGRFAPTPRLDLPLVPQVAADEAIRLARDHLLATVAIKDLDPMTRDLLQYEGPTAQRYLWTDDDTGRTHLVWHVQIRPNLRDRWSYFIDAHSGRVLERYNATATQGPAVGQGQDLAGRTQDLNVYEASGSFFMLDATRSIFADFQPDLFGHPLGALVTLDANEKDLGRGTSLFYVKAADNNWSDAVAVSAHSNTAKVFQYYQSIHGRDSFDGRGGSIISVVHVTDDGDSMGNAFWNGALIAYGDRDAAFNPLATSLDVAAHEITHGVIERTVNLEYRFQSGALNESLADVFGAMLDRDDWLIGEDAVKTRFFTSGALRNMEDPHNGGDESDFFWQPAHMDEFAELEITQDNGGVHVNSGIPNRACFLLAEAIGREKTEQIYYRVMDARYLNTRANFVDMRLAAERAAGELFGAAEAEAVRQAFDTVGILGVGAVEAPRDTLPVYGEQWIAVVNAAPQDSSLYLVRPDLSSDDDIIQLTQTQIFTITGNPVSASDDGSLLVFVDSQNFVRAIHSNGTDERVISVRGEWRSVALSPDGRRLAATSVFADTSIFIFDLIEPENSRPITLYTPTTQEGVTSNTVQFADAMDWDLTGTFLVYDALNSISQEGEVPIKFWNVNLLDVDNEIIFPLFPAQPQDISIGNPSFSQTTDRYIAYDLIDFANETDEVWIVDLFTGESALIEDNGSSLFGFPRFSTDDRALVIQREEGGEKNLRQIPLTDSRIEASGPSEPFVTQGQLPTWFAVGTRQIPFPTNVEEGNEQATPTTMALAQNFPNPFNSTTTISYHLSEAATITLNTYDLTGQLVHTQTTPQQPPGHHQIQWTAQDDNTKDLATGIYIYRLTTTTTTGQASGFAKRRRQCPLPAIQHDLEI